jgi:hypothetical protein
MSTTVPVLAAPMIDPGQARRTLDLPSGLSLAQMADHAFPDLPPSERHRLRIVLVSETGAAAIEPCFWSQTRPRAGVRVVMRLVPGKDALRSVLLIVVQVAALAFAGPVAGLLGLGQGAFAVGAVGAGLTVIGSLLVNALVPMPEEDAQRSRQNYRITGWANEVRLDEPVPDLHGLHRVAPPFAATSYTEIVGDQQFVRAVFCVGLGPIKLSDIRLGETSIADYSDVEMEVREGRPDDEPLSLYPRQVLEETEGIELVRPQPVDDKGDPVDGPSEETPVVRQTAADTQDVNVIFAFPTGLFAVDDKGRQAQRSVTVRIRQRLVGDQDWQDVATLAIAASSREPVYRQHSWQLAARGKWDLEFTRMTDDSPSSSVSDQVQVAAIQSIRPEYPVNMDKPLALISLRIRATHQLNGPLDNLNCLAQRYARRWDGTAWTEGLPRTPAAAFVAVLQGASNPFPATDTQIDWDAMLDWLEWCELKGLRYDQVIEQGLSLGDLLREICAAGRAVPRHDGIRWSVTIDRPAGEIVDHISPRNSSDFTWQRAYFDPPHAFRVTFFDETNDYKQAERIVPWPGHTGPITVTEQINLPGKTNPREIWIEARRRMYELIHRPDTFTTMQGGMARVVTRGDLVMGSYDVLDRSQIAARVVRLTGHLIELDEPVPESADGMRYRSRVDEGDVIGSSVVSSIKVPTSDRRLVNLPEDAPLPGVGDLIHLGPVATVSLAMKVKGIEGAQDFASVLHLVAAAPEIDTLTDAELAPDWTGRVGSPIVLNAVAPDAPRFVSVVSFPAYTGGEDPGVPPAPAPTPVQILLRPGGLPVPLSGYRVEHRLVGAGGWADISFSATEGGGDVSGYTTGDQIQMQAYAVAVDGTESPATAILTVDVGGGTNQLPPAIEAASVMVEGAMGHARIIFAQPGAPAAQVRLFRVPFGFTLDRETHVLGDPIAGLSGTTVEYIDGDATRLNLLANVDFDGAAPWVEGTDWTVSGDQASHVNGTASDLSQVVPLEAGKSYRFALDAGSITAGSVTPVLTGSPERLGQQVSISGMHLETLTSSVAMTGLALRATADFAGAIKSVALFAETPASVPAGTYSYYLEPLTDAGLPGPLAGPFQTTIK